MPSGSRAGLDGLRPKHLQQMLAKETIENGRRLLGSLTRLANLMLNGGVPDFSCPALYGASLCSLTKKKNGGIRPIAVGSVLRRLTTALSLLVFRPLVLMHRAEDRMFCYVIF